MYHVFVSKLAQHVLGLIRREELLHAGDRVGLAVSGGIDSVALLLLMLELRQELGIVLSVVHFNHKLRGAESDADQKFVAALASQHGLEFYTQSGDVAQLAAEQHGGLEAAARELRYRFFWKLLGANESDACASTAEAAGNTEPFRSAENAAPPQCSHTPAIPLNKIATGHTLDDQAETVLMRLIRGTGMKGLGAIYPRIVVDREQDGPQGEIVRPLLGTRRRELENYLADLKQPWREDSTNTDSNFTRNRVRKRLLPLLEREFNPAIVESFAQLAEIARDEEDYWENEISGWLGTVVQWERPEQSRGKSSQPLVQIEPLQRNSQELPASLELPEQPEQSSPGVMNVSVSRPWLLTEPKAVQRRTVKAIAEQAEIPVDFKHVEEILRFAAEDGASGKELILPLGWKVVREPEAIVFVMPDPRGQERTPDYEYALAVPGLVAVPELGVVIEALRVSPRPRDAEYNPQQLLSEELLPEQLRVRNWRAGDRFWPAHTKSPRKIKELLQGHHVAQPARRLWPVVAAGDEIVWMRGFPVPARLRANGQQEAILIRELPWSEDEGPV
jgi:tRNA(Ile)-lysidine synthase